MCLSSMENNPITIPVQALMTRQPDGTYKIAKAEYVTVAADILARFFMGVFGLSGDNLPPTAEPQQAGIRRISP